MTTEEILGFENNDGTEVHLVRDRLFWQAWEHSAFLFLKNFRKYQVHHKFVQKVSKDLVWLGFPKNVLQDIHKTSQQRGFSYEAVSDSHIVIKGIPAIEGFDKWKSSVIAAPKEPPPQKEPKPASNTLKIEAKTSEYLLYRLVFDFTIYCTKLIPKVNRVYRHPIGDRIINELTNVSEHIYLYVNHCTAIDNPGIVNSLLRIRLDFRLLNELKEISLKQWMFVNTKIEEILKIVSPESLRLRTRGASNVESSILPTPSA